jgi:hypothetical protein
MATHKQFIQDPVETPPGTHAILVNRESFGYSVTHRFGGKTLYTATYKTQAQAQRRAMRLAAHYEFAEEDVLLCLNQHFR